MKKLYKYLSVALLAIAILSCSKESQIEGLIATEPTVVEINTEITQGTLKTIPVTINNVAINLQINYSLTSNGATQTRFCIATFMNNVGGMPLVNGTSFINKAEVNTELSSSLFVGNGSYSGYLIYTTNPINNANYTYINTNGIKYGNSYYVPIKFLLNGNLTTPLFAYMKVTIAADKVTINKIVYKKVSSLKVGEE